ncbi:MAG: hypothetical protein Q7S55_00960 [Nanoarchaeota archaeon]|nr:hypothetical protein [Nanoarchaeota archaeon]
MSEDHEKKRLQLVVNNEPTFRIKTPIERLREEHQAILEKKEEGYNKTINDLRDKHAKELKRPKLFGGYTSGIVLIAIATAAGVYVSKYTSNNHPEVIVELNKDLNKDGIDDAFILQKDGYKIPMYGVESLMGKQYLSARKMERSAGNIIDYQSIEDKLNKE